MKKGCRAEGGDARAEDVAKSVREGGVREKLAYRSPRLEVFGSVSQLTLSGASGASEMASMLSSEMATKSDRSAKENIVRIGTHPAGFGLYLFSYRPAFQAQWGTGRHFGVMADEVERVFPNAVFIGRDGYKRVSYPALGISLGQS